MLTSYQAISVESISPLEVVVKKKQRRICSDKVDFSPLLLFHYISLESSRGEMLSTDID